jgi:rhodanese-related sulfurtransferase
MLKNILTSIIFLLGSTLFLYAQSLKHVDVEEFEKAIKAGGMLVDVRTDGEVKEGKIPKSQHWDWFDDQFDKHLKGLDKNKPILFYCHSGGRSTEAGEKLVKMGFKEVYSLNKGIVAWKKAGKPLEK